MAEAAPVTTPATQTTTPVAEPPATGAARGPDGKFAKADAKADAKATDAKTQLVKLLNGKELSMDEVVRLATKQAAGEDRFREAAELKKTTDAAEERLKQVFAAMDRPEVFAREIEKLARENGKDPIKLAEALLAPMIQAELEAQEAKALTPEQKKARELERENAALKRQAEEAKKQAQADEEAKKKAEYDAAVVKHQDTYADLVQKAMEASKLPKTAEIARDVVTVMKKLHEQGIPLTQESVNAIGAELWDLKKAEFKALQEAMGDDYSIVAPNLLKAARKAEVDKLKAGNPFLTTKPISKRKAQTAEKADDKRRSPDAVKRDVMMGRL